jgi:glycosyltransferase involved in cell wall biosynthesis/GT2 family glycosyltransferase
MAVEGDAVSVPSPGVPLCQPKASKASGSIAESVISKRGTRKGRIALVTPDIVGPVKNGGIGTACFHYARSLANAGYEIEVLFSGDVENEARSHWRAWYAERGMVFLALEDVPSPSLPTCGLQWFTERAHRIMHFLRGRNYDYVIFQDWHANAFWSVRARRLGAAFENTPIGVISHSPNEWQKAGMQSLGANPVEETALEWSERQAIADADVLISPSHHMIGWLQDHGYPLPARVAICPITFEDETEVGRPESVDRDHIIFFGRLETRKGLHLLGDALREVKSTGGYLPQRISFLGKAAEVRGRSSIDYLRDLRDELAGIDFTVETEFHYFQAVEYIKKCNGIVVIPSTLDNYPLTVIESIVNGFCFIASDAGGIPEMIDPVVCFPATVDGLKKKLEELPYLNFARLSHPYSPALAREIWLAHVGELVAERRRSVSVHALRDQVPPVSVCVPFYRHDMYLGRMISSFLGMHLPQLQLVIVDDGTPPNERATFDALRRELEPLGHIFRSQPNAGPGAARNRAASLAQHDLLLFFDADNVAYPDLVERLCIAMARSGADSISVSYVAVPPMLRRPISEDGVMRYIGAGGPASLALLDNVVGDACALIRRTAFEAMGGFAEHKNCWEDWEFFLRAVGGGLRHYVYPDPLFYYTMDPQGRNGQSTKKAYSNRQSLLSCLNELPPKIVREIANIFVTEYIVSHN